jgi:hypothetical protein
VGAAIDRRRRMDHGRNMVTDMDEYARRMQRITEALAPLPAREPPEDEGETDMSPNGGMSQGWREWRPRQTSLRKEVVSRIPDSVVSRQVENAHAAINLMRGELEAHKANTQAQLDALADEAGAQTGKLAKQIGDLKTQLEELQSQLSEARRDIGLLRSLQPQKLLSRKGVPAQTIEGSLATNPLN